MIQCWIVGGEGCWGSRELRELGLFVVGFSHPFFFFFAFVSLF